MFQVIIFGLLVHAAAGKSIRDAELKPKAIVYLTFDDGPNEGTPSVLNVLKKEGIKATFFINSKHLFDPDPINAESNAKSVFRVVNEGHILADHSYDHMSHNSYDSPVDAYADVEADLAYFGKANSDPVIKLMKDSKKRFRSKQINKVDRTMNSLVRMPYSNNWRVSQLNLIVDCSNCTVPVESALRGIEIANRLASAGKDVFGWDSEWKMNFEIKRKLYGGADAFENLLVEQTKIPGKIVILSHDIAFKANGKNTFDEELSDFIRLSKENGYIFRTLETYVNDKIE